MIEVEKTKSDNNDEVSVDAETVSVKKDNKKKVVSKLSGIIPLVATATFLLIGFTTGKWHPAWIIFLSIPFFEILINTFNKHGKAKIVSLTILICITVYLVLGFTFNLWHPTWLIFFLIPIVSIIVD